MMTAPGLPDAAVLRKMENMGAGLLPQLRAALQRLKDEEAAGNPLTDDIRGWRAYYTAAITHMEAYVAAHSDTPTKDIVHIKLT